MSKINKQVEGITFTAPANHAKFTQQINRIIIIMTETSETSPNHPIPAEELLKKLRRKEGNWVEWGQACQTLQKAGYNPQTIFEETGFEPIQQNQVIVGAQVYTSMMNAGISEAARAHFQQRGSDILYELRILTQSERAAAANFIFEKKLDADAARELAKAMKDFSRLATPPEGFTNHPGDTVAYQCWKLAKQKADLQERSRLIAKGLSFAHSQTARQQIEKLLTDFSVTPTRPAPRLPVYRLEEAEQLPRILPVVGKLPLKISDWQALPRIEEIPPFQIVKASTNQIAWLPMPGWQVIYNAQEPVAILCDSNQLPYPLPGKIEEVVIVVDCAQQEWDVNSYFLIEQSGYLQLQWFEEAPNIPLLGKVILIMRPKKIFDEEYIKEPWQIDE